jgi:hypothetical protein
MIILKGGKRLNTLLKQLRGMSRYFKFEIEVVEDKQAVKKNDTNQTDLEQVIEEVEKPKKRGRKPKNKE